MQIRLSLTPHPLAHRWLRGPITVAMLAWLLAPLSSLAEFTAAELAVLPRYCHSHPYIGQGPKAPPAEQESWKNRIGLPEYMAMHHYCWAQMWAQRAYLTARTPQDRRFAHGRAIADIDFVLRHVERKEFVLLPEILNKKAEHLLELGRAPEAVKELLRAIEVKPDYWPPYASLSDYYKKIGEPQKAREWVEKGLAADPAAKPLLRRQAELKGGESKGKSRPSPATSSAETPARPRPNTASQTPEVEARQGSQPLDTPPGK